MDLFYVFLGMLFAIGSGVYLIYESFSLKSGLEKSGKLLYLLLGIINIYAGIIYLLVLVGFLPIVGYGIYIRPVAAPIFAGDGFVAFYHRKGGER